VTVRIQFLESRMSAHQKRKRNLSNSSDEKRPPPKMATMGKAGGSWKFALLASMDDPKYKVFEDEHLIVIKDKYPKARYHFLVMPKEKIDNLGQLTSKHIDLLEKMKEAGQDVAAENGTLDHFRLGFHAMPSMSHLHMHVVSQDFDSPCLKRKEHWNSFTTDFFRDVDVVLKELKETGKVEIMNKGYCDAMMKQPLRCHICKKDAEFPTLPKLKEHLKRHEMKNPQ